MKAITLRPPWPTAIFELGKNVENRTNPPAWRSLIGQRVAIHAGLTWSDEAVNEIETITGRHVAGATVSVITGTVLIADMHTANECWNGTEHCSPWAHPNKADGRPTCHLVLRDPIPLPLGEQIKMPGALGAWNVPSVFARQLEAAIA